jgi:hypothetical protein
MRIAIVLAAALISGCAASTASYPVEVTRFRVDEVGRGTITLIAASGDSDSLEFRAYADALGDALSRRGYTVLPRGKNAAFVAIVTISIDRRTTRDRSPVSIGLGGGTFSGGGVGLGGGVSFPIGRGRTRENVATILSVKINTADDQGVWEGRATTRDVRPVGTGNGNATATKLANALFTGFPGESGRTIEVK